MARIHNGQRLRPTILRSLNACRKAAKPLPTLSSSLEARLASNELANNSTRPPARPKWCCSSRTAIADIPKLVANRCAPLCQIAAMYSPPVATGRSQAKTTKGLACVTISSDSMHARHGQGSSLFSPSGTPAFCGHLLACKQRASTRCSTGRSLEESAVRADLTRRIFGLFGFVDLARIGFVAEGHCLRIRLGERCLGRDLLRGQYGARCCNGLHDENAARRICIQRSHCLYSQGWEKRKITAKKLMRQPVDP